MKKQITYAVTLVFILCSLNAYAESVGEKLATCSKKVKSGSSFSCYTAPRDLTIIIINTGTHKFKVCESGSGCFMATREILEPGEDAEVKLRQLHTLKLSRMDHSFAKRTLTAEVYFKAEGVEGPA